MAEFRLTQTRKAISAAIPAAMNKAGSIALNESKRQIRKTYTIKAKELNRATKLNRATRHKREVSIVVKEEPIPLSKFKMTKSKRRGRQKPLKAEIRRGDTKTYKFRGNWGFWAQMKSGHIGGFARKYKRKQGDGKKHLKQFFGPSTRQLYKIAVYRKGVKKLYSRKFKEYTKRELSWRLTKQF